MVVGFPLDIARYAIMTHVVGKAVGMTPGRLFMPSANSHIYENCYGIAEKLTRREVRGECQLQVENWGGKDVNNLRLENFALTSYDPHEAIKVEVN